MQAYRVVFRTDDTGQQIRVRTIYARTRGEAESKVAFEYPNSIQWTEAIPVSECGISSNCYVMYGENRILSSQ